MKKIGSLILLFWTDSTAFACVGSLSPFEQGPPLVIGIMTVLFNFLVYSFIPIYIWGIFLLIITRKEKEYFKVPRCAVKISLIVLFFVSLAFSITNYTECVGGVGVGTG